MSALPPQIMANDIIWDASGLDEIAQNMRTLVATEKGSVPLLRQLGLDMNLVDSNINTTASAITQDVIAATKRWEPRAKIETVSVTGEVLGGVTPHITWSLA